ncbi:2,3-bisphosphoglycerate-independent phosphoglycerate mutase [Candidatus Wolfebacteria bacterium CG03_land_8_20_14_0_80_40_12]|uniref:2,3-bisphosphoglycerate-independent phosphoglycerate mutase n=1 Tax=Candidatus Wolfebacteria bacterium CG03_land_8_20_14_0_80_40_12 TaxID=1975069 RepID=A0A2M7B4Z6_9BACT|nr:MAG: 2,3-bisphosphoglycerate-independent phosphoglycerate mutase [Candidatus Wolfebacteria bacterium CG03_land_8_20_14_0_80_40_12]
MSKRTIILIILDGWGMGEANESNPIYVANPQNIRYLKSNFPTGGLQASGIGVGLPWGEEGNSEVGHLNLGVGRVIYQYYPKISLAIREKTFFENPALKGAFKHAKENGSAVNLVGLLSNGNVHASFEHLLALIEFAKKEKIFRLNLHLFTDGRDSPPHSAIKLLSRLPKEDFVRLASLSGRFYAMDREKYWERTQKAYEVLVGEGQITDNLDAHIKKTYERKFNDEFVEPTSLTNSMGHMPEGPIKDNDSIIFFNFREDRMKQIASAFIDKSFKNFPIKNFNNLYVAMMTQYDKDFNVPTAFLPEKIETCLGKILSDNNKFQLRIAETQKYPHITYFFNGMKEKLFKNEYRILIPSRTIIRQDERPEMMAPEITARVLGAIEENVFDFILVNYANPDIIAHTGNYEACLQAIKVVDEQIGKIVEAALGNNAVLIITSDHGNIEKLFDPLTGLPETQHNPNSVPIYLIAKEFERRKTEAETRRSEKNNVGLLADVAPTILELMAIPKPKEMTGQSLLRALL